MKMLHFCNSGGRSMSLESKRFQGLRYGTGAIVIILYLIYLAYLISQIFYDKPLIQISHDDLEKLSIPDVEVCCNWSDIVISKLVFNWKDWSATTFDDTMKNKFIIRKDPVNNIYCYLFSTNDTYFYGNPKMDPKGQWVRNIDFYFKIENVTAVTSRYLSVGTFSGQLMDPKFNPLWKVNSTVPADIRVLQEFRLQMNAFAGIQNMTTMVFFKKVTYRSILPQDFSAILGINPKYYHTPYLTSISKNILMHPNDSSPYTGHFNVAPGSFIHEVQSEKRSYTILGTLGLAGGAFGVISGIYILLFGRPRINPWGIMHLVAKSEIARDTDLQNMPFVSVIDPIQNNQDSTENRTERLENRIQELETILTDYVINPSILERLSRSKAK